MTVAVRTCSSANTRAISAWCSTCRADTIGERLQGRHDKTRIVWLTLSMIENLTIAKMFLDCGGSPRAHVFDALDASRVRLTDAPSGNCTDIKKAPWSPSGRNPVWRSQGQKINPGGTSPISPEHRVRKPAPGGAQLPHSHRGYCRCAATPIPWAPLRATRAQEHGAQRRRQCQRIQCRDQHCDVDRHQGIAGTMFPKCPG